LQVLRRADMGTQFDYVIGKYGKNFVALYE
jgi:hypothetical protein